MENNKNEVMEKATYEQLENYVDQLAQQNAVLRRKLTELADNSAYKRLDYLFKVVENKNAFPEDFTEKCVNAIVETFISEDNNTENTENKTEE
jgi:hypothetical protein